MHCLDDALCLGCYITYFPQAGLHKCISSTVDNIHCSLIFAVHLDLGSPQLMAPDPNHRDHCLHLKSWNVESGLADSGRKLRLKILIPHTTPQPTKQASIANIVSGSLHLASGIKVTLLNSGKNFSNHVGSHSLTHSVHSTLTGLGNKFRSWDTNTPLPDTHTQSAACPATPATPFFCFFSLVAHLVTSNNVSYTLSGVTSITISTVSIRIPRNTILVAGRHALDPDSVNPRYHSSSPRNSKAPWAISSTSAPRNHQDNLGHLPHSACIYGPRSMLFSGRQCQMSINP